MRELQQMDMKSVVALFIELLGQSPVCHCGVFR